MQTFLSLCASLLQTLIAAAILLTLPTNPFDLAVLSMLVGIFTHLAYVKKMSNAIRVADLRDVLRQFQALSLSMNLDDVSLTADPGIEDYTRLIDGGEGSLMVWVGFRFIDAILWIGCLVYALYWKFGSLDSFMHCVTTLQFLPKP